MANIKISEINSGTVTIPNHADIIPYTDKKTNSTKLVYARSLQNWIVVPDTWTYASATTITVPSGAASIYSVGDRLKLTQSSTVKYFYVVAVADTLLTITGGSDYSLTNTAISSIYFSHIPNPTGFPFTFGLSDPTWTTSGTAFTNQPTNVYWKFSIVGRQVKVDGVFQGATTSGGTGLFYATFTSGQLPPIGFNSAGMAINLVGPYAGMSWVTNTTQNRVYMSKTDATALFGNSQYAQISLLYLI